jgi:hypothetical protein
MEFDRVSKEKSVHERNLRRFPECQLPRQV